ncbi:MAG: outer membrane protein assembly factor BamB family protein, partial [Planctomycetota bacterium]
MVSLFTTATSSSATPNDARRAHYMAESGIRYALSEIRNNNFNDNFVQTLNSQTYTLDEGGSFSINIFSPWFEYTSIDGNNLTLDVPNAGKIPKNFSIPNITLIHWNNFKGSPPSSPPPADSYEPITGSSASAPNTSLTITVFDSTDFTVNTDDVVCLAVQPTDADTLLQAGEDIYVELDARDVFPPTNGAIRIVTSDNQTGDYYYTERIDEPSNSRVKLTNLAALPGTAFAELNNFSNDDWVVLSRHNYRLLASGTSGGVTVEIGNNNPLNIFSDAGLYTITMDDLVADAVTKESDLGNPVFNIDAGVDKKITIGGSGQAFGDLWYGGEKPIGNDTSFCQQGRCLFGIGIRAFFTLNYAGDGEGFIFSLIAGGPDGSPTNTRDSVGGDFQSSELLGYAGDSRLNNTPVFLDGSGNGLLPPKIGLEFDTRTNFDPAFEQSLTADPGYCSSPSDLRQDTRNDPKPGGNDEHAVQNVFWGTENLIYALCRGNNQTYDDNRHEAEGPTQKWVTPAGGIVSSEPVIGSDTTVYTMTTNGKLHAIDPVTGAINWTFPDSDPSVGSIGSIATSPAINDDGSTVYFISNDLGTYKLHAIDTASKLRKWNFPESDPSVFSIGTVDRSSPAVDKNDNIYFGSQNNNFYAVASDGMLKWIADLADSIESSPVVDRT